MQVHAEIEYTDKNGQSIHSDICPPEHDSKNLKDAEYRKYIHLLLDEWLDNSNGTGQFYIKGYSDEEESARKGKMNLVEI